MKALRAPFRLDGGSIASVSSPSVIAEQKIVNCLVTSTYERVGFPQYGAGAADLVMDNVDELVEADFTTDAKQELANTVSGVSILGMRVREDPDTPGKVDLLVRYQVAQDNAPATLSLSLDTFLTEETPI